MRNRGKYIIATIIIVLVAVMMFCCSSAYFVIILGDRALTDGERMSREEMVEHFYENRDEFEEINDELLLLGENGLRRIDDNWTSPDDVSEVGLTAFELAEYRDRLDDLSIPRGVYTSNRSVQYLQYTSGLAIGGTSKGYYYSDEEPKNYFKVYKDEYQREPYEQGEWPSGLARSYEVYTKIDGNWYLFEEYED